MTTYTAEQIEQGIAHAIGAHDFEAVRDLIRMLAKVDPHRAEVVLATIKVGLRASGGAL